MNQAGHGRSALDTAHDETLTCLRPIHAFIIHDDSGSVGPIAPIVLVDVCINKTRKSIFTQPNRN